MTNDAAVLPHRYPFRLLDRVIALTPGEEIVALKRVSFGDTLMGAAEVPSGFPLTLLAEGMAQAASIVATSAAREGPFPAGLFAAIKRMELLREPRVGDEIRLRMRLVRRFGSLFEFAGEARVGGELIGEGQLVLSLTETDA